MCVCLWLLTVRAVCSVAENESENKMSLQNLATVFGPTVLRPAIKGSEVQTMEELFSSGTRDAMMQTSILMTFLNLRKKGAAIWRFAQCTPCCVHIQLWFVMDLYMLYNNCHWLCKLFPFYVCINVTLCVLFLSVFWHCWIDGKKAFSL